MNRNQVVSYADTKSILLEPDASFLTYGLMQIQGGTSTGMVLCCSLEQMFTSKARVHDPGLHRGEV